MTMLPTRLLRLTSILLGATVGCGDEPDAAVWTQTDSAGVNIVSGPPPQHEIGVVASTPTLEISFAADVPMFRTSAVLPRQDGSFVVLDSGNHRVLLFEADGSLRTTTGRQGDGPGEFQSPASVSQSGDSTLVYDRRHRRVTVYGPNLEFARDRLLEGQEGGSPPQFTGVLPGGVWVGLVGQALDGPPPHGLLRSPVAYVALDGDVGRVLATGRGSERWVHIEMDGAQIAAVEVIGYGFYRTTAATIAAGSLVVGDTDLWAISMHSSEGQLIRSIRMEEAPRPFGEGELQQFLDGFTDDLPVERRAREQSLAKIERPATLPAFAELLADDQGRVWARKFALDRSAAQRWIVFDTTGAVGTADLPRGFALRAVRADRLYGVFRDDFDVESVRVYKISAPM